MANEESTLLIPTDTDTELVREFEEANREYLAELHDRPPSAAELAKAFAAVARSAAEIHRGDIESLAGGLADVALQSNDAPEDARQTWVRDLLAAFGDAAEVAAEPEPEPELHMDEPAAAAPEQSATIELFKSEALAQLDVVETAALRLEGGESDPEVLSEGFRAIHSLKGNCGYVELPELEQLAHHLEDVLDIARSRAEALDQPAISVVLEAVDALRGGVAGHPGNAGKIPERARLLADLHSAAQRCQTATEAAESAEPTRAPSPPADNMNAGTLREGPPEATAGSAVASPGGGRAEESATPSQTAAEPRSAERAASIRVDIDKLDALLDQVGELITAAAAVVQSPDIQELQLEHFHAAAAQLHRVTSTLHENAMAMRMVPLGSLFRKMPRVVRDLRHRLHKDVELEIDGQSTEVDKSVSEAMADPLVHIIRNAIDHGIELPDERRAQGKNPTGKVRLAAKHQGGEVWITVEDDGAGIDHEAIAATARAKGLIHADASPSPEEALQLLFSAGFSTAKSVTSVSGRGVGMDVVRRSIEAIRGRVEVSSARGSGTRFTIRVPLTLAIIDAMLVRVQESVYALPLLSVRESFRAQRDQLTRLPQGPEIMRIRDRTYPVVGLDAFFARTETSRDATEGIVVLIEDGATRMCILVDEVLGQRQIVVKPLTGYTENVYGLSGCSILADGVICLILDPAHLASAAQGPEARKARAA